MAKPIYPRSAISPCSAGAAIVPNDGADLPFVTKSIYIGGNGNLAVVMAEGGNIVTFIGLTAGQQLDIAVTRVNATNTTATNMIALG